MTLSPTLRNHQTLNYEYHSYIPVEQKLPVIVAQLKERRVDEEVCHGSAEHFRSAEFIVHIALLRVIRRLYLEAKRANYHAVSERQHISCGVVGEQARVDAVDEL